MWLAWEKEQKVNFYKILHMLWHGKECFFIPPHVIQNYASPTLLAISTNKGLI